MPVSYGNPDSALLGQLAEVMERYHKPLHDAGVRVGIIMARDDDDAPAIVSKGYPVLAQIKVVPLKDRLKKGYDAELLIDAVAWDDLTEAQRIACLDHELSHIALKNYGYTQAHDAAGKPTGELEIYCQTDDLNRPKLRTVPGDLNAGDMFESVIRRHGMNAVEFQNIHSAYDKVRRANDDHLLELGKAIIDNPVIQTRFEERKPK